MINKLQQAEKLVVEMFNRIQQLKLITPLKLESEVNHDIYKLAEEEFGITHYWHKRIVRAGTNTLFPYKENPPDIRINHDDIVFIDFGPLVEDWEADIGRSFVLGDNSEKQKLCRTIEIAWHEIKQWVEIKKNLNISLSCKDVYKQCETVAQNYGYTFGGEIAGHLVGRYPHERLESGNFSLYVHPKNTLDIFAPSTNGEERHWILELHFVHSSGQYAAFFEQLLF